MSEESRPAPMDRRRFLTVLGASSAGAAALAECSTDRVEKLIPYLVQSEDQIPGLATWYASTCTECSGGCGVHVRTREGRAVKLEGNPEEPTSGGALCARGQAALQELYAPDRFRGPLLRNAEGRLSPVSWEIALGKLTEAVRGASPDGVR